ncbi:egg peptide speract receptor-like [Antedon mediterranea]|uniref:egg peptide speract receptor-like n=1 Tax=Antedon mediterranea TaxID=105859 RepID=UPI003AF8D18C
MESYFVLLGILSCIHVGDHLSPKDGDVIIEGGFTPNEGYIRIYYNGNFGLVCSKEGTRFRARMCSVVCRSLGYNNCFRYEMYETEYITNNVIALDSVKCSTGSENNLMDCQHDGLGNVSVTSPCILDGKVDGVNCSNNTLDIRLINGQVPSEGRVELLYDGKWRYICGFRWDKGDANVACYQAGFSVAKEVITNATKFLPENKHYRLVKFMSCRGGEPTLSECCHSGFNKESSDCGTDDGIAGVVCENNNTWGRPILCQ